MTGNFEVKGGMYLPKFIGWGAIIGLVGNIVYMAYSLGITSERFVNLQTDIKEIKVAFSKLVETNKNLSERLIVLETRRQRNNRQ